VHAARCYVTCKKIAHAFCLISKGIGLKGIVHPKVKILPQEVPTLYELYSSIEHKLYFEQCCLNGSH